MILIFRKTSLRGCFALAIVVLLYCLFDLSAFEPRCVVGATAVESPPPFKVDESALVAQIAKDLLDDSLAFDEREAAVARRPDLAGAVIHAMTQDLSDDLEEEYRRIPWIWRVAIAAGKSDDVAVHYQVLVASLPEADQPLTHWQAVVLGGGLINGWSLAGHWPAERLKDQWANHPDLQPKWERTLELASSMADDEQVPSGTRYDALRMIALAGWEQQGERLRKYLQSGVHDELQMGAISASSDIDSFEATTAMLSGLAGYSDGNRAMALQAMLRTESRINALLDGVERGEVQRTWITPELSVQLKANANAAIANRAARLFP